MIQLQQQKGERKVANQLQIENFTGSPQLTARAANQRVRGRVHISGGGERKEGLHMKRGKGSQRD